MLHCGTGALVFSGTRVIGRPVDCLPWAWPGLHPSASSAMEERVLPPFPENAHHSHLHAADQLCGFSVVPFTVKVIGCCVLWWLSLS